MYLCITFIILKRPILPTTLKFINEGKMIALCQSMIPRILVVLGASRMLFRVKPGCLRTGLKLGSLEAKKGAICRNLQKVIYACQGWHYVQWEGGKSVEALALYSANMSFTNMLQMSGSYQARTLIWWRLTQLFLMYWRKNLQGPRSSFICCHSPCQDILSATGPMQRSSHWSGIWRSSPRSSVVYTSIAWKLKREEFLFHLCYLSHEIHRLFRCQWWTRFIEGLYVLVQPEEGKPVTAIGLLSRTNMVKKINIKWVSVL